MKSTEKVSTKERGAGRGKEDPLLQTEGVSKRFGQLVALDDVHLTLNSEELHAIIGPNGAGKTTLFNVITGAMAPSSGRVFFKGNDITTLGEESRANRGLIRVFQIPQIFPELPILENVRLAIQATDQNFNPIAESNPTREQKAEAMLEQIQLASPPETMAKNLSHGDKKKLEIGMAMVMGADVLLLDEPTSGVGEGDADHLIQFISDVAADIPILLVEHNVDMVFGMADRITVLHQGSVIATGKPDEIRTDETVRDVYLGEGQ